MDEWRSAARSLAKRGLVQRVAVPAAMHASLPKPGPCLNAEQQAAVDTLQTAHSFAPILLDGVTGSVKTEVYLLSLIHI